MDTILNLIENNSLIKKDLKHKLTQIINSYKFKRVLLHVLWAAFNFPILLFGTNVMLKLDLTYVWIGVVVMYMPCYWLFSSIIFDYILGDDLDNVL